MFIYKIPSFIQKLFPAYTWKVNTRDKQLFLTFDDGPHPKITPWVLHLLSQFGAKATFFCVADNVKKYPEVFAQILAEGHAVGNHTFRHLNGYKHTCSEYIADVKHAEKYIDSTLFRPPYGKIKRSQAKALLPNYKIVMWDRLSADYDKNLNIPESTAEMKKVENGSIVVFHDSEKAFANLQLMLPNLLLNYSNRGFQFCCIAPK
ncbi:MAG: polysaccharide deacetylase family protein [bacterium]|nr:polysaccharide deacetylase family protein [bacterium]